jgi:hypothetical protein
MCVAARRRDLDGLTEEQVRIPTTPDESFILDEEDTIATVQRAHHEACAASRAATSSLSLDDKVGGNRRGPLPQLVRE